MKSMRLSKAIALSFLFTSAVYADIHDRIEYKLQRVLKDLDVIINGDATLCTPINQLEIDQAGGTFFISQSGLYCVTEDVAGLIVVDADCVCIDLGCHTLDANGGDSAIVGTEHQGLKVFNGCITNSADAAIFLTGYSAVELHNLHIHDYFMDGVRVTDSSLVSVHDVDFVNDNAEERAVLFEGVDTLAMNRCNATGFLSTIGAVVQFDSSTNISMTDVNVTNCTKTLAASAGFFPDAFYNVATRLVSLNACSDFDLTRVKVNNNMANSVQETNVFEALCIAFCANGFLNQCETNNNIIENGGFPGVITLPIVSSNNIFVTECQSNSNFCNGPIDLVFNIFGFDTNNIAVDSCQVNSNRVTQFMVIPGIFAAFIGIGFGPGANNIIRNSQANLNRIDDTDIRPTNLQQAFLVGLNITLNGVAENSEANGNSIGTTHERSYIVGLNNEGGSSVISNCIASDNVGGEFCTGFFVNTVTLGGPIDTSDVSFINCSANSNNGYGFLVGDPFITDIGTANRLQIIDSTFNNNGRETSGEGAGIKFLPLTENVTDVLIKGCTINGTFADSGDAAGINIPNASNVVIEDTIVNHTSADGVGHGILFDTVNSSKILRCQFHENQDSGVEIQGDNDTIALIECVAMFNDIGFDFAASSTATCCLVQDCRAISNLSNGFVHGTAPLTSTFIGNEAHCNGDLVTDNYDINGGVISLQELDWTNGDITVIDGNAILGAHFTNLRSAGA